MGTGVGVAVWVGIEVDRETFFLRVHTTVILPKLKCIAVSDVYTASFCPYSRLRFLLDRMSTSDAGIFRLSD